MRKHDNASARPKPSTQPHRWRHCRRCKCWCLHCSLWAASWCMACSAARVLSVGARIGCNITLHCVIAPAFSSPRLCTASCKPALQMGISHCLIRAFHASIVLTHNLGVIHTPQHGGSRYYDCLHSRQHLAAPPLSAVANLPCWRPADYQQGQVAYAVPVHCLCP
ncbi:hypothetical protein COO60DRAFT_811580 [Scenedesmus sp. NREL 46B-D3]|nr:hypothetical protein COO60DRAFT_811580 [Scenedesmus sp. NREL 46B-D3]